MAPSCWEIVWDKDSNNVETEFCCSSVWSPPATRSGKSFQKPLEDDGDDDDDDAGDDGADDDDDEDDDSSGYAAWELAWER